jgi:uncharacterized protein (TIGR02266 family)
MKDLRLHPRMVVALTVNYPSKVGLERDLVTDLSQGGLFVRTSRPLPIGTEIDLEVLVGAEPVRVRGRVVWLRDETRAGMGIQFTGEGSVARLLELAGVTKNR